MSTHKTSMDEDLVMSFLKNNFSKDVLNFKIINGGEGSQAYSFKANDIEYIIRINKHYSEGFKKDEYAYTNYSSQLLPIPKIYQIGKMDNNYHFCISQKVEGVVLNLLKDEDVTILIPELFNTLDTIHSINISNTTGYGKWNENGQGKNNNWRERILSVDEYTKETAEKLSLFETSFLEKNFWDKVYNKLLEVLIYCPEERYLIHGDYGFGNILAANEKITGVIDWEASMYGDFLFDVAWLSVWSKNIDYEKLYEEHYISRSLEIKNYKERILCYKLYIGLSTLSFFAYSNQEDKYNKLKETISKLI